MNRRVVSTRNKYLVLEEKWDAEGRDGHTSEGGVVESGGPSPRNKSWSSFTDKVSSNDRLKLSMTKVDGFNCAVGPTTPSRGKTKSMGLAERKCIPTKDVLGVLQTLSSTLIFNTATKEERLALASRLRRWAVEDGTYLIREGDGDTNQSAIFMIASGKATISLNRTLEDGSVQEADVKDIKSPNYFGEGRVLGDSRAYASVRAKEELVVYYIVRADVEQLVSPKTRALMVRDMQIRKFQKENLDDLFGVIREYPSGMRCLARFAEEQLMGGDVMFFNDVEEYKRVEESDAQRRGRAQRISDTYIWAPAGGPGLIYTSEAQRKALAGKMRGLWGKPSRQTGQRRRSFEECEQRTIDELGDGGDGRITSRNGARGGSPKFYGRHHGKHRTAKAAGEGRGIGCGGDDGVQTAVDPDVNSIDGDGYGEDEGGESLDRQRAGTDGTLIDRQRLNTEDSDAWSDRYRNDSVDDDQEEPPESTLRRSLSLFDEILDQNAIPTIHQNIVPKFIQSSYYEIFLAELFPEVDVPSPPRAKNLTLLVKENGKSGEAMREGDRAEQSYSSLEEEIASAVAAAMAVATAATTGQGVNTGRESIAALGSAAHNQRADGVRASLERDRSAWLAQREGGDEVNDVARDLDGVFSDELLVVIGFRHEGVASRMSRKGLAGIQAASDACVMM